MAVRVFAADTSPRITLDEGTLDTFRTGGILNGAWTAVVVFKRVGNTNDGTQFFLSASNGGSLRFGLSVGSPTLALQVTIGGISRTFGASFTIVNNQWYVFAVRKTTGTATPQGKLWNAQTGAVIADWTNATGTVDDDANIWDQLQLGNRVNDFPLNGKLGGGALFSASLDNTAGNTLGTGFDEWLAIGTCVAMWPLTQAATTDPVLDQVGDADQTAITATSVDTGDDPAAFDLTIGGGGGAVTLEGSANAASSATGAASVERPIAGTGSAASSASATLTRGRALDASAPVAASASATLTRAAGLASHADAAASATGSAQTARALSGVAPVAGSATGSVDAARSLSASASAASGASGDLSIQGQVTLAGSASVASGASAGLSRSVPLSAVASAAADASGALSVRDTTPALEGSADVVSSAVSPGVEVLRGLAVSASVAASAVASLSVAAPYVPAYVSVEGTVSVSADLDQGQAELVGVPTGSTVASGLVG
jgi:hypothetical protein